MKTYVIILSQNFPAKHPKAGQETKFEKKVLNAVWRSHNVSVNYPQVGFKMHTIRANYELWRKRFEQIEKGKARLSIRQWSGKPYHSKQVEICKLSAIDGIGLQQIRFAHFNDGNTYLDCAHIGGKDIKGELIAVNDGLSYEDWSNWFKKDDLSKPFAIIHFTKFRY